MNLQPPGGELTGFSLLWLLFSVLSLIAGIMMGNVWYLLLAALVGLPTIGIWLSWKPAGWILFGLFVVTIPLGLIAMVLVDADWSRRALRLVRVAVTIYFAYLVYRWSSS